MQRDTFGISCSAGLLFVVLACGCQTANHTKAGALVGAGIAAPVGAIIGHQSGHGVEGAIIGAATGAIGGGLVGNAADAREERDAANRRSQELETAMLKLSNYDLIKMAESGLGDEVIINAIRTRGGRFDLSTDGLIELKTAGISDHVITELQSAARLSRSLKAETGLKTAQPLEYVVLSGPNPPPRGRRGGW